MWSTRSNFLPRLLGNDYWDMFDYPTSIFDQDFGLDALDYPRRGWGGYRRGLGPSSALMPFDYDQPNYPLATQGFSNVQNDREKFAVNLDCKQFTPEEVNVTVDEQNNQILIHGKHEERSDEHGHVSREFRRRYALPSSTQLDKVECNWNNGVLSINAPKIPQQPQLTTGGRQIPINMAGGQQQGRLRGPQQQSIQPQQQQYGSSQQQIPVSQQGQQQDVSAKHQGHQQTKPAAQSTRG